jgi:hypothetical protein
MHPFSVLTLAIFVAGYITARWDLVTRLYELAIFAWDHGVVVSLCRALPNFRGHILIVEDIGTHGKGIRNSFNLLLPIHHTSGEACLQGDGPGGGRFLERIV